MRLKRPAATEGPRLAARETPRTSARSRSRVGPRRSDRRHRHAANDVEDLSHTGDRSARVGAHHPEVDLVTHALGQDPDPRGPREHRRREVSNREPGVDERREPDSLVGGHPRFDGPPAAVSQRQRSLRRVTRRCPARSSRRVGSPCEARYASVANNPTSNVASRTLVHGPRGIRGARPARTRGGGSGCSP